jgi:hypothetical protein
MAFTGLYIGTVLPRGKDTIAHFETSMREIEELQD